MSRRVPFRLPLGIERRDGPPAGPGVPRERRALVRVPPDHVSSEPLRLEALDRTALGPALAHWRELIAAGEPSQVDMINAMRIARPAIAHLIDTDVDDPMAYVFRMWGTGTSIFRGTDLTALRVGQMPSAIGAEEVAAAYHAAASSGEPRAFALDAVLAGRRHRYTRLVLPFRYNRDGPRLVTRLLVCSLVRRETDE